MFGERLRELRKDRKLTQTEISKLLNISQITYSQYERNARKPDMETLIKLADFFKVSLDYLMCRYDKVQKPDNHKSLLVAEEQAEYKT